MSFIGPRKSLLRSSGVTVYDFRRTTLPAGATLTRADASTCATRVNSSGLIETVPADVARFTHDPVTLALQGLLVEPSRTNLAIRSEAFDNAAWSKTTGGTGSVPVVTADDAVAPDGTTTADKIEFDAGAGVASSDQSMVNSTSYSVSIGDLYCGGLYLKGTAGGQLVCRIGGDGNYVLQTLTGGWDRIPAPSTASSTAGRAMSFGIRQGVLGTINSAVTLWAWGGMAEIGGLVPSSYIKTEVAAVARATDMLTLAVPNGTYGAIIERLSGVTILLGQTVTAGTYAVPTDVSPVRRVTLRRN